MHKNIILVIILVLLCQTGFLPDTAMADPIVYKKTKILVATANPAGSVHVTALEKFCQIIETETKGAVKTLLFTGGSMGDEQANVKQLRTGEIHVTAIAAGNATPFAPCAAITVLPYMFPKIDKAYALFGNQQFVDELGERMAKQSRTRALSWLIGGYRVLTNSKKPVTKIADLQGLKIRVPGVPIQLEAFRSWGIEPYPLAWSETFNALQQGVVDGQENPHSINRDQKFWEVQEYISDLHYMLWVGPIMVSEWWYQNLDDNMRALVDRAAHEAARYEWEWAAEQNEIALGQCMDHGMKLSKLEDEKEWETRARKLWPKFYDAVGGKQYVDQAMAAME